MAAAAAAAGEASQTEARGAEAAVPETVVKAVMGDPGTVADVGSALAGCETGASADQMAGSSVGLAWVAEAEEIPPWTPFDSQGSKGDWHLQDVLLLLKHPL